MSRLLTAQKIKDIELEFELLEALRKSTNSISLTCASGTFEIEDGNLDIPENRYYFITGACGDLARAIYEHDQRDFYFICRNLQKDLSENEIKELLENPYTIFDYAEHVILASIEDGFYADSYGRQTIKTIKELYGEDIQIIKGSLLMLQNFHTEDYLKFSNFAKSAIELDALGKSYSYFEEKSLLKNF